MIDVQIVSVRLRLGGRQASIQLDASIGTIRSRSQKRNDENLAVVYQFCNSITHRIEPHRTTSDCAELCRTTPQAPPAALVWRDLAAGPSCGFVLSLADAKSLGVGYDKCSRRPRVTAPGLTTDSISEAANELHPPEILSSGPCIHLLR